MRIVKGSSISMKKIPSNSVQLIVTSPPYAKAKAYRRDDSFNIGNYTGKDYLEMMIQVYRECYRVLQPGRKMCINISNLPAVDHMGYTTEARWGEWLVNLMEEYNMGFSLRSIIIWHKGRCRAPSINVGTFPYPGSPVLLNNWEYIYVFRKHYDVEYNVGIEEREASKMSTEEIAKMIYTVWSIPTERDRSHIAPFPPELPRRLIKLFSFKREIVLDPFLGSGTSMQVAMEEERSCYGYEIGYNITDEARELLKRHKADGWDNPTWLDLIKWKVGWNQQSLSNIVTRVNYDYIEDNSYLEKPDEILDKQNEMPEMVVGGGE